MDAEKELIRRFYRGLWSFVITWIVAFTIAISLLIAFLVYFFQGETKIGLLMSGIVFLAIGFIFVVGGVPYFRDLSAVKHRKVEVINGTVIKYNKIKHGGDFTTYSYMPVVKDHVTGKEVELTVLNNQLKQQYFLNESSDDHSISSKWHKRHLQKTQPLLNKQFTFVYLKHTRIAIIKESDNKNNK